MLKVLTSVNSIAVSGRTGRLYKLNQKGVIIHNLKICSLSSENSSIKRQLKGGLKWTVKKKKEWDEERKVKRKFSQRMSGRKAHKSNLLIDYTLKSRKYYRA
jgi:hypothetical protein